MLYIMEETIQTISIEEYDPRRMTVGYVNSEELQQLCPKLEVSPCTVRECQEEIRSNRSCIDLYEGYSFGTIHVMNIHKILSPRNCIGFYVKSNLFLVVERKRLDDRIVDIFPEILKRCKTDSLSLERIISFFFERLLAEDAVLLEQIDYKINQLEDQVLTHTIQEKFYIDLLVMKRELFVIRNYYEQLLEICETLSENQNEILCEKNLSQFQLLILKINRLSNNTQILRENLVQVREGYQSYLDYSLNSIMKVFTVVTTIFLPLTLIVGWYGMNFTTMPEITWKYGYLFVIVLSLLVVAVCIYFFKKKKLL